MNIYVFIKCIHYITYITYNIYYQKYIKNYYLRRLPRDKFYSLAYVVDPCTTWVWAVLIDHQLLSPRYPHLQLGWKLGLVQAELYAKKKRLNKAFTSSVRLEWQTETFRHLKCVASFHYEISAVSSGCTGGWGTNQVKLCAVLWCRPMKHLPQGPSFILWI